ncbi:MAG TPA: hypothetical protein VK171_14830, partial [Fimbriimonas sp.]|nr:hypothetical protein [Fimbriimonas sp.]
AGTAGRFVSDIFEKHDVGCLGPGRFGEYSGKHYARDKWSTKSALDCLHRLAIEMQPGDLVVLRSGLHAVGIGIVADAPYEFNKSFDDLFGWDLQHTRRIIWQDHLVSELKTCQQAGPLFRHMKQMVSLTRLQNDRSLPLLRPLLEKVEVRQLRGLPPQPTDSLSLEQLGQRLFSKGLSNETSDRVVEAVRRLRRLYDWYQQPMQAPGRPTEHEVVAHMILPLLVALGWSEQLLAVEWHKVDLAAFGRTPTDRDSCVLVCEAKSGDHGLQDVEHQAFGYISRLRLTNWRKVLVTQGGRYYVFSRKSSNWEAIGELTGYYNLDLIREDNIFPSGTNQIDTLVGLTPTGVLGSH